jgi:hypothetical protein
MADEQSRRAALRFTSETSDKLFHLPSLAMKHFPFNAGLFSLLHLDQNLTVGASLATSESSYRVR